MHMSLNDHHHHKPLDSIESAIRETRMELDALRMNSRREGLKSRFMLEELRGRNAEAERSLHKILHHAKNRVQLHEYAAAIQVAKGQVEYVSQYVIAYEAQVCRAIHHMSSTEHQYKIMNHCLEDLQTLFDSYKSQLLAEKPLCQQHYLPQIEQLAEEKFALQTTYLERITEQEQELAQLQEKLGIQQGLVIAKTDEGIECTDSDQATSLVEDLSEKSAKSTEHHHHHHIWDHGFVHGFMERAQRLAKKGARKFHAEKAEEKDEEKDEVVEEIEETAVDKQTTREEKTSSGDEHDNDNNSNNETTEEAKYTIAMLSHRTFRRRNQVAGAA